VLKSKRRKVKAAIFARMATLIVFVVRNRLAGSLPGFWLDIFTTWPVFEPTSTASLSRNNTPDSEEKTCKLATGGESTEHGNTTAGSSELIIHTREGSRFRCIQMKTTSLSSLFARLDILKVSTRGGISRENHHHWRTKEKNGGQVTKDAWSLAV
jgi:hypothetical protein